MPKLDGVSATSLIRRFDHMTPIISMTSNSRPAEILKYYSSGMNDILPKPFTKDGLFDMLEVCIHNPHFHYPSPSDPIFISKPPFFPTETSHAPQSHPDNDQNPALSRYTSPLRSKFRPSTRRTKAIRVTIPIKRTRLEESSASPTARAAPPADNPKTSATTLVLKAS